MMWLNYDSLKISPVEEEFYWWEDFHEKRSRKVIAKDIEIGIGDSVLSGRIRGESKIITINDEKFDAAIACSFNKKKAYKEGYEDAKAIYKRDFYWRPLKKERPTEENRYLVCNIFGEIHTSVWNGIKFGCSMKMVARLSTNGRTTGGKVSRSGSAWIHSSQRCGD